MRRISYDLRRMLCYIIMIMYYSVIIIVIIYNVIGAGCDVISS